MTKFETEQSLRMTYRNHEKDRDFNAFHLAANLVTLRPKESTYRVALDAAQLYKLARSLSALAVARCNYELSKRQETRSENIARDISTIAGWYGLKASCSGDPRGYVVRLLPGKKKLAANGWGDGFGIA